ncbi:SAM-dependent methyltransferase [Actinomycetes bacterium]|nr:SAM-dependent methyltransferase [Actinomycetes bacterium]
MHEKSVGVMELTGERTMPGAPTESYWFARHQVVYRWVAGRYAVGQICGDIGSGEGFGTQLLMDAGARSVFGVELDENASVHSAINYPVSNFIRANVVALPIATHSTDLIVSLQVIEHIWDVHTYLQEMHRVLRTGGILVISTPNRPVFSPGLARKGTPLNPFHVEEFDAEQIQQQLTACEFAEITMLGLHHGARITTWERINGPIVDAMVVAATTSNWPDGLLDFVTTITAADFVVGDPPDAQDLIAIGVK